MFWYQPNNIWYNSTFYPLFYRDNTKTPLFFLYRVCRKNSTSRRRAKPAARGAVSSGQRPAEICGKISACFFLFIPVHAAPTGQGRTFPSVSMLSVTGHPREYAWCGGSPWESRHGRGHLLVSSRIQKFLKTLIYQGFPDFRQN